MASFGSFLGTHLPFGASNKPNPTPAPGFPSSSQLNPANPNDPNNPANKAANAAGNNEPNNDPNNNADPNKGPGNQGSSLDTFKDLFKLPTDDKGNVISTSDPFAEPLLKVDPAALQAAAKKMNFGAGINPETLQKAMSGNDPQSFMEVINQVAQNGFAAAMQANANVVETAFGKHNARFESVLPDRIRSTQINQAQTKHPALAHPAAAPIVQALKGTIAQTNPHLSPDRVAEMAENYVIAMASDINKVDTARNAETQRANGPKEMDWNSMLGLPSA